MSEQGRSDSQDDATTRAERLVAHLHGVVWEADAVTGQFLYVSPQAERLFGFPLAHWLEPDFWAEHIHPDDRAKTVDYCLTATAALEDHYFEYRMLTADGGVMWVGDSVSVIVDGGTGFWLDPDDPVGSDKHPEADDRGAASVAIISAALWQRKFGAAREAVGQSLKLGDKSYTVIGVLPAGFTLMGNTDVYAPIGQWGTPALQNRQAALGLHGIGRLKPGVTLAQAQADLDGVMRRLTESHPDANRRWWPSPNRARRSRTSHPRPPLRVPAPGVGS